MDIVHACQITARVREESKKLVKPGAKYIDVVEKIEERIRELGGKPAFPVNISVNDKAAHDTARPEDEREISCGDVVKIDLGAHINGWPGDTAYTIEVDSDKYKDLLLTTKKALEEAIKITKKGVKVSQIGKTIQTIIQSKGYEPIRNLGGHPLNQYKLHGDFMIPNYDNKSGKTVCGYVAIEPFATNGLGYVRESNFIHIFSLSKPLGKIKVKGTYKLFIQTLWNK